VLPNDYPGIHLFIAWTAATLLAASLARIPVPERFRTRPRSGLVARAAIACAVSVSIWLTPNGRLVLELFKVPGAVLVPFLARSTTGNVAAVPVPPALAPWYADRRGLPDVAPTAARVLPANAIVLLVVVDALRAEAVADRAHATLFPNLF